MKSYNHYRCTIKWLQTASFEKRAESNQRIYVAEEGDIVTVITVEDGSICCQMSGREGYRYLLYIPIEEFKLCFELATEAEIDASNKGV